MTRDDDAVSDEVETPVPLVIRGVPEEDAADGARGKLMRGGGRGVRVAGAPKHAKVIVGGGAEQGEVGGGVANRLGGKAVQEISGGGEGFHPVGSWEGGLKEETAEHVVSGANHAFSSTILRGGVGTGESELNAVGEEESAGGGVIKFTPIVALKSTNRASKLGGDPREEV